MPKSAVYGFPSFHREEILFTMLLFESSSQPTVISFFPFQDYSSWICTIIDEDVGEFSWRLRVGNAFCRSSAGSEPTSLLRRWAFRSLRIWIRKPLWTAANWRGGTRLGGDPGEECCWPLEDLCSEGETLPRVGLEGHVGGNAARGEVHQGDSARSVMMTSITMSGLHVHDVHNAQVLM